MVLPHLVDLGLEVHLLAVRHQQLPFPIDTMLSETMPDSVVIHYVDIPSLRLGQLVGVSATGLRAWFAFRSYGLKLLSSKSFDVVFFSTTAFPLLALAKPWKARFGVKAVFDFQDPWVPTPGLKPRTGLKHNLMRRLHRELEPRAMAACDAIVAVSGGYIDDLKKRYRRVEGIPCKVLPFCVSNNDIERSSDVVAETHCGLYVGALAEPMLPLVLLVCRAIDDLARSGLDVRIHFKGTDYAQREQKVLPITQAAKCADVVSEDPRRAGYFESIALMRRARFSLVLGSTEEDYVPSKLFNVLASAQRVLVLSSARGALRRLIADGPGLRCVWFDAIDDQVVVEQIATALKDLLSEPAQQTRDIPSIYTAEEQARQLVDLFEKVA